MDEQLKASLKEIGDLKAALDEHAIVAITGKGGKGHALTLDSKFRKERLAGNRQGRIPSDRASCDQVLVEVRGAMN